MSILDRLAALSPEQRAALERRLLNRRTQAPADPGIQPRSPGQDPPLSFAQQRLWILEQLEPGSSFYNLSVTLPLSGPLHPGALSRSLAEIVRRHEALRTSFATVNGAPVQIVNPPAPVELQVVDLTAIPEAGRVAEARRWIGEAGQRPFDLTRSPLLRAQLVQLASHEHVLALTMHHIACDGWSLDVLRRELAALYAAFVAGRPSPLPELKIQYADYALWERSRLRGDLLARTLAYWRTQLADIPPLLALPTDRLRPPVQVFRGAAYAWRIPASVVAGARGVAGAHDVTLFMTLLAVFGALLARWSRQELFALGTPVANRSRAEVEDLIGFFVNTLVLRMDLSGDPSFAELVGRVRDTTVGALASQDLPFDKLVEELQPERALSHNPLFQVMFALQSSGRATRRDDAAAAAAGEDARDEGSWSGAGTSKFDLTLSLEETPGPLLAMFEYNSDLFDRETIESLARAYQVLLGAVVHDPTAKVARLPLVAPRPPVATAPVRPPSRTALHHLWRDAAARAPEAIAVCGPDGVVRYRELQIAANRLARALIARGIRRGSPVAVCVDRSPAAVIAALAIWKAGGMYMPLDIDYPAERLGFLLNDAEPVAVVADGHARRRLPELGPRLLALDTPGAFDDLDGSDVDAGAGLDDPAYLIYTSGSTGMPKGVVVAHRGVCHVADEQVGWLELRPDDRILQFASASFDAAIFEMVMAATAGAALHVAPTEQLAPGPALVALLADRAITIATLPPSTLAALPACELPALRAVIAAGEACGAELVARWAAGRRMINAYGPTEASIWATAAWCVADGQPPPIGRPLAHVTCHVVDDHLVPVPVGAVGELVLGGPGVALGYLRRPELTTERFVADPSGVPGARAYRTGDLVRERGGQLYFLGRNDAQVKLRGFRIELTEIESELLRCPGVREVAVTIHGDALVAHVVHDDNPLPSDTLAARLAARLPDFMVPRRFVAAAALPRGPHGKLDRRALPPPADDAARRHREPRTATERELAQIWCAVLGRDAVGLDDDFFALGGHSLLASGVVSRAVEAFGVELPLRRLFDSPTVARLAAVIDEARQRRSSAAQPDGPIPRLPRWGR